MKARHYLLIPALAAMAVSCSSEADVLQPEKEHTATVRATTEYTPATRTLFGTPTGNNSTGYTIPLTWNEDETKEEIDVVGLYASGSATSFATSPFRGVAGSRSGDGKSMAFSGTYPAGAKVAYFYPSGAFTRSRTIIFNASGFTTTQTQTGNDNRNHLSAVNWMYSDAVATGDDFTLHPMGAIVRFDLTFPTAVTGGTIKLSSDKRSFIEQVDISYTGGTVSVDPIDYYEQSIEISGINTTQVTAYMMVAAAPGFTGLQDATLTLEAEMTLAEGGTAIYTQSLGTTHATANWEAGKCYNFAAEVEANEITMWEREVPLLWSMPGQVTVYRNVPDGLSDITNAGLTVGSKLVLYYTTTDDGYQIQINNSHWNSANWGIIHTAGFYPDAPAGANVKCEITLNAVQLDELLNLSASWGGSSCLNIQGAGCTLLKVCVRP